MKRPAYARRQAAGLVAIPPALRHLYPQPELPKLDASQVRDIGLIHVVALDAISKGQANPTTLWEWAADVLLWSHAAQGLQQHVAAMAEQLALVTAVAERFQRTGRVGFSGPEYQTAKRGVDVMDELAATVDQPTALAAAAWSEANLQALAARYGHHVDLPTRKAA